jgi:hypothetical protein
VCLDLLPIWSSNAQEDFHQNCLYLVDFNRLHSFVCILEWIFCVTCAGRNRKYFSRNKYYIPIILLQDMTVGVTWDGGFFLVLSDNFGSLSCGMYVFIKSFLYVYWFCIKKYDPYFVSGKKKQSAVSEKWIVTMTTHYEQGSRTKDSKGKNRDCNEKFGEQRGSTIPRVIKFLYFTLKLLAMFFLLLVRWLTCLIVYSWWVLQRFKNLSCLFAYVLLSVAILFW